MFLDKLRVSEADIRCLGFAQSTPKSDANSLMLLRYRENVLDASAFGSVEQVRKISEPGQQSSRSNCRNRAQKKPSRNALKTALR